MQANSHVEVIKHSLELDEKLSHQIKGWKAQKICGVIILIIIGLTALGLFGGGPLSWRKIEKTGTTLQYEAFTRVEKEMDVSLRLSGNDALEVTIPMRYLDHFKLEKIVPDAYESRISGGNVQYSFKGTPEGEMVVHFFLYPKKAGNIKGVWQVNQQNFQLTHFIYP